MEHKRPHIQDIFNVMKNTTSQMPEMTEEELKNSSSDRHQKALFVPDVIQKKFDALPKDVQDRLQWYGNEYYSRVIDEAQTSLERNAYQLLLLVKSGLSPKELDPDEKMILVKIYGPEWWKEAGLSSEDE